jgi:hypothetical protein
MSNVENFGKDSSSASVGDQAGRLARDAKQQAMGLAKDISDTVGEQASHLADTARNAASAAGDKLRSVAEDQKDAGAARISSFASAIRQAADAFDQQLPEAGDYIRLAAERVDDASEALRRRDIRDLVDGVQDFARRQPTAFLGLTVLAGFAAVRFLKSATEGSGSSYPSSGYPDSRDYVGSRDYTGSQDYSGRSDLTGSSENSRRLGGAATHLPQGN